MALTTVQAGMVGSANAAVLLGPTLSSNVTASSLTSVGTLTGLSVSGQTSLTGITTLGLSTNYPGFLKTSFSATLGSPIAVRQEFSTDGTGWQYRLAKNVSGTVTDLVTLADSGNFGIGTTSPATTLSLYAASKPAITLTDSTLGSSYGAQITGFGVSGNGGYLSMGTYDNSVYNEGIQVQQQATSVIFKTNNGYNGITTARMTINSSGQVTLPYQPAFFCWWSSGSYTVGNNPIIYNNVGTNRGSCYNASTGKFTAPVSGEYFFSMKNLQENEAAVIRYYFCQNGALLGNSVAGADGAYQSRMDPSGPAYREQQTSAIIYMNAGDTVYVCQYVGTVSLDGAGYSTFLGYLLG